MMCLFSMTWSVALLLGYWGSQASGFLVNHNAWQKPRHLVWTVKSGDLLVKDTPAVVDKDSSSVGAFIVFSHSFQRHVVFDEIGTVLQSYEFLDDAETAHPNATLVRDRAVQIYLDNKTSLGCYSGCGLVEQTAYREIINTPKRLAAVLDDGFDALTTLSTLVVDQADDVNETALFMQQNSENLRFLSHTPGTIMSNYKTITRMFKQTGIPATTSRAQIFNQFPFICTYPPEQIAWRIHFLLGPLPPPEILRSNDRDWPQLSSMGYGAGLSKQLFRRAVCAVPHLLSMYYQDAATKPSLLYFLETLQTPMELTDEAQANLRKYIDGVKIEDYAFVGFLKSLGLSWTQLQVILDALPTLLTCDSSPSWEMLTKGVRATALKQPALNYYRTRFQLRPSQVKAMFITHPRLATYSIDSNVKPTVDDIQTNLCLTSRQTRELVLKMPSLLGMSRASFNKRIDFFVNRTSMASSDIKKAVVKCPAILGCSVDSLSKKVTFFTQELGIPHSKICNIITAAPTIFCLSLDANLRPSAESFLEFLGMNEAEMGYVVLKAPQILGLSWQGNVNPKLLLLMNLLDVDLNALKDIVLAVPRALLTSADKSLRPKFDMIAEALDRAGSNMSAREIIINNPSLLSMTNKNLEKRLQRAAQTARQVEDALKPQRARPKPFAPTTRDPLMVNAAQTKVWQRPPLISIYDTKVIAPKSFTLPKLEGDPVGQVCLSTYRPPNGEFSNDALLLVVYTAGRVYPSLTSRDERGRLQQGGMSLFFPQVAQTPYHFEEKFATLLEKVFPQKVPAAVIPWFPGTAQIGFPHLWPSRARCELAACSHALRAFMMLLLNQNPSAAEPINERVFQVEVYTGSDYILRLLGNETRLEEWSRCGSMAEMKRLTTAADNPDLLYGLSQTVQRLKSGRVSDDSGNTVDIAKKCTIRFRHVGEGDCNDENVRALGPLAGEAAKWYYERDKTAKIELE